MQNTRPRPEELELLHKVKESPNERASPLILADYWEENGWSERAVFAREEVELANLIDDRYGVGIPHGTWLSGQACYVSSWEAWRGHGGEWLGGLWWAARQMAVGTAYGMIDINWGASFDDSGSLPNPRYAESVMPYAISLTFDLTNRDYLTWLQNPVVRAELCVLEVLADSPQELSQFWACMKDTGGCFPLLYAIVAHLSYRVRLLKPMRQAADEVFAAHDCAVSVVGYDQNDDEAETSLFSRLPDHIAGLRRRTRHVIDRSTL